MAYLINGIYYAAVTQNEEVLWKYLISIYNTA
jgi:hypothetical protein